LADGLWWLADGHFSDPNHHIGDAHLSQSERVLDATNTRLIGVAHGRFLPPGGENRTISQGNQCAVECGTRRAREQAGIIGKEVLANSKQARRGKQWRREKRGLGQ